MAWLTEECWNASTITTKPATTRLLLLMLIVVRAPSDAQFARLLRTRTDFHPLQICPVRGVDPLNLLVRDVFTL